MTSRARLRIAFTGYWLSGTGAARGRDVDAVAHRDRDHLPAMPMTQVKGQLRETAERLAAAGAAGWDEPRVIRWFGQRSLPDDRTDELTQGALAFRGEARLPDALRRWLAHPDQAAQSQRLFVRLAFTAIGPLGAALDRSLRAIEAVVPVELEGEVAWRGADPEPDWVAALDMVCASTLAFGKLKTDGYGRAIARVTAE